MFARIYLFHFKIILRMPKMYCIHTMEMLSKLYYARFLIYSWTKKSWLYHMVWSYFWNLLKEISLKNIIEKYWRMILLGFSKDKVFDPLVTDNWYHMTREKVLTFFNQVPPPSPLLPSLPWSSHLIYLIPLTFTLVSIFYFFI